MNPQMLGGALQGPRLGRFFGIDIHLGWSWFFIAFLCLMQFSERYHTLGAGGGPALLGAALITVLFFGSILAHEFGHALTARRLGIRTRSIKLNFLGGAAILEGQPRHASHDLAIAAAGPMVSLLVGIVSLVIGLVIPASTAVSAMVLRDMLLWLGWANIVLGAFNLLPAFPLDGGRMLRAWLWARSGNRLAATLSTAATGNVVGWMVIGAAAVFFIRTGAFLPSILIGIMGVYLRSAGRIETLRAQLTGGGIFQGNPFAGFGGLGGFGDGRPPEPPPPPPSARESRGQRTVITQDGREVTIDE